MFKRYKLYFSRPAAQPAAPSPRRRPERDVQVEALRRFAAAAGMMGDLESVHRAAAFGILEIRCTERLARRLLDMPELDSVQEA